MNNTAFDRYLKRHRETIDAAFKTRKPYLSYTSAVVITVVWLVMVAMEGFQYAFAEPFSKDIIIRWGGFYEPLVQDGQLWRFFSSIFVHVSIWHILMNLVGTLYLMPIAEKLFGWGRTLGCFLLAELIAVAATIIRFDDVVSAGISVWLTAAVGLMTAYQIYFYPVIRQQRIPYWIVAMVLIVSMLFSGGDSLGHILGFGAGFGIGWLNLRYDRQFMS